MRRAEELTLACDLFVAIGSSLVVWPAAGFPLMAKRNGAKLVIINREPTDFDDIADLVIRHDIGERARAASSRTDSRSTWSIGTGLQRFRTDAHRVCAITGAASANFSFPLPARCYLRL